LRRAIIGSIFEAFPVGVTIFVMLVGLVGLIVPIFPGLVVIWLAALGYGVLEGFQTAGIVMFALITLAMVAGAVIDNVLMGAKARQAGASGWAIGVGMLAGVVGTLLYPPVGGLLTAPLGILLTQYYISRDWQKALQATRGLALGCGWGFVLRFFIGVLMIGFWGVWAVLG
jgi:uncharacterized protein YqgC (DUF456 family)